ncbi:MAG TPA: hypothetical protein VFX80_12165 [Solirubrobacteraceae bacterium]|nr:hypothetical protein [Solirubrobacteraceae bacterium]
MWRTASQGRMRSTAASIADGSVGGVRPKPKSKASGVSIPSSVGRWELPE